MKIMWKLFVLSLLMISLSGCGDSGGDDLVGGLTLDTTATDNGNGTYNVSALATYSHPTKTDLVGVEIGFKVIDTFNNVVLASTTKNTPTNGKTGVNMTIFQAPVAQSLMVVASTGNLQDSKPVSIPALGAITPNPTSLTFTNTEAIGTIKNVAVTGGTAPYFASSNDTLSATVTSFGNTVSVRRESAAAGSVIITITDAIGSATTFLVTLQ
jgi:hypothetical protein